MRFCFFPLRFHFLARDSVFFPPGKAANTLRGALGTIFKRIACRPDCQDSRSCDIRQSCPYAQVFEPGSRSGVPSGLVSWPRPFVFRARHLDGMRFSAGEAFFFDLHVFTLDPKLLWYFVDVFAEIAREGVGPHRARADLQRVQTLGAGGIREQVLHRETLIHPVALDLAPALDTPKHRIAIEFLSPTELKHEHRIAARPEFPILFGRIRDRISTLRALYGEGSLPIDFRALGERAATVQMTRCDIARRETDRRSSRTGQSHSIGGFIGRAEYEGDVAEFLPYLETARWTGVGRQAVWGKGEIKVDYLST